MGHQPPLTHSRQLQGADPERRAPASAIGGPEKALPPSSPGITSCLNPAHARASLSYSRRPERTTRYQNDSAQGVISKSSDATNHKGRNSAGGRHAPYRICSSDIPPNLPLNSSQGKFGAFADRLPGILFSRLFAQLAPLSNPGLNVPYLPGCTKLPDFSGIAFYPFP